MNEYAQPMLCQLSLVLAHRGVCNLSLGKFGWKYDRLNFSLWYLQHGIKLNSIQQRTYYVKFPQYQSPGTLTQVNNASYRNPETCMLPVPAPEPLQESQNQQETQITLKDTGECKSFPTDCHTHPIHLSHHHRYWKESISTITFPIIYLGR